MCFNIERSKLYIITLLRTVRGHFLRKNFFLVFVWVNFGDSQIIFGTQAGRTNVPVKYDLPVETGEVC